MEGKQKSKRIPGFSGVYRFSGGYTGSRRVEGRAPEALLQLPAWCAAAFFSNSRASRSARETTSEKQGMAKAYSGYGGHVWSRAAQGTR